MQLYPLYITGSTSHITQPCLQFYQQKLTSNRYHSQKWLHFYSKYPTTMNHHFVMIHEGQSIFIIASITKNMFWGKTSCPSNWHLHVHSNFQITYIFQLLWRAPLNNSFPWTHTYTQIKPKPKYSLIGPNSSGNVSFPTLFEMSSHKHLLFLLS